MHYSIVMIDPMWHILLNDLQHLHIITQHDNVTLYKSLWRKFQTVCVKRIQVTPQNFKYVQREFDILKICVHPCVYQFFGACVEVSNQTEYVYFVFEYMENGNLMEYVQNNTLSYEAMHNIVTSIAVGMHYLCSRKPVGIIHRDFKPENILINKHLQVKIADFGISKHMLNTDAQTSSPVSTIAPETLTQSNIGTVRWCAPEILCYATPHTQLSDIYSLGLLIHFVFSDGKVPYMNEYKSNGAQIAYAKSQNKRPFLNDVLHVPQEFELPIQELINACTELDQSMRPQHPEYIIEKLLNFRTRLSQSDDSLRPEHGNLF